MLNEIIGMYLADENNITTDRIFFTLSIDANDSQSFTISDANNGVKLKSDLTTYNYYITKYNIWSQNGILDVTIKPDNESINQIKLIAFTKATEAPLIPPKSMIADLTIDVTNNQSISDDLYIALEIYKIPQNKIQDILDTSETILTAPANIDVQTLATEKYTIYNNELLKTLIRATKAIILTNNELIKLGGGTVPPEVNDILDVVDNNIEKFPIIKDLSDKGIITKDLKYIDSSEIKISQTQTKSCRR